MYEALFPYADKMYITEIEKEYDATRYFLLSAKKNGKRRNLSMGKGESGPSLCHL